MRIKQLDVLRCLAVLVVIVRHMHLGKNEGLLAFLSSVDHSQAQFAGVARSLLRVGWVGVDLFFVLSGFLVSGLLFQEHARHGDIRVGRFLVRRGFKIYPPFYFLLVVTVLFFVVKEPARLKVSAVISEAAFVQNYGPNIWGHTWSLAVEEHFYILLSLLLLVLSRRGGSNPFNSLPAIFVGVALVCLSLRIVTALTFPLVDFNGFKIHVFPTHLRIDSLFFGVLLSYYFHCARQKLDFWTHHPGRLIGVSLALVAPVFFVPQESIWMRTIGFTSLYLGFGGLLLACLRLPDARQPFLRRSLDAAAAIGRNSYSIYLWHMPVITIGVPLGMKLLHARPNAFLEAALCFVGCLAGGIAMARLVEFPALAIRDRYFPSRAPGRRQSEDREEVNALSR